MIDRMLYVFSNPWSWIGVAFVLALPYLLVFIRSFYPQKIQDKIKACELKQQNPITYKARKAENKILLQLILPIFLLFTFIFILINWICCEKFYFLFSLQKAMGSAFLLALGLFSIFYENIVSYSLKDDYIAYKENLCSDEKFVFRFIGKAGYLFVLMGLYGFITFLC